MNIRELTIMDYEAVIDFWQKMKGIGLSSADEAGNLALFLERNPHLSFIAFDQGRLAGTALCGHDGRRGFIYHLAVDPACRRNGIGRQLVECCLAGLKTVGIEKCHIMVLSPAILILNKTQIIQI
jgi:ribosomal protein S18 acetylase RimI-like enzyme